MKKKRSDGNGRPKAGTEKNSEVASLRAHWDEHGFIAVAGLFSDEWVAELRRVCDHVLARFLTCDPDSDKPGNPNGRVMRHLTHPSYFDGDQEGFRTLMHAVADPRLREIVAAVLGEPPLFRCTSYWYNPVTSSSDGNWHRDCQFWQPDEKLQRELIAAATPQRRVQLMLALAPTEDTELVPDSHMRWDTEEEYFIRLADDHAHCRSNDMPGALRLRQRPGDVVAFHPCGLHRGRYHTDKLRRTLMLTYTVAGAGREDYFVDQPWFLNPGYLDGLEDHAQAFFQRFIDRFTPFWQRSADD